MEATTQLNVRVPVALADKLRKAAAERHTLPGSLVAQALEQFLSVASGSAFVLAADSGKLEQRLAAIERRLAVIERAKQSQQAHHLPHGPAPAAAPKPAADPPPEPKQMAQLGDGAISTADLATATGTNRAAWNNWARDKNPGAIRKMGAEVGNWLYLGKFPSELGGPDRGMWERA